MFRRYSLYDRLILKTGDEDMWLIIIIIIAVGVYVLYSKHNNSDSNSVPAEVPGVMKFVRSYFALCNKHNVQSSGIRLTWEKTNFGSEINAWVKIYKIDGVDASERIDLLRMAISNAKLSAENNADPLASYHMKDKLILDFFGTEDLHGSFWDIDDCSYIDGKYLEFSGEDMVIASNNQSVQKTMESICARTLQINSNARIEKQGSDVTVIHFR